LQEIEKDFERRTLQQQKYTRTELEKSEKFTVQTLAGETKRGKTELARGLKEYRAKLAKELSALKSDKSIPKVCQFIFLCIIYRVLKIFNIRRPAKTACTRWRAHKRASWRHARAN
jgi:hypothetical protein